VQGREAGDESAGAPCQHAVRRPAVRRPAGHAVAYDKVTGDLYAATDFGVLKLAADATASGWVMAAQGLPVVTAAGLTMNADSRQLLAATHGRGAYQLTLP
jgi:hypothetical protein